MAYKRSVFPESIDALVEITDLPPSQKANALRYQTLKMQATLTSEEQIELNSLTTQLQNYLITPETFNKFSDICIGLEVFFTENTLTYINNLKTEMQTYVTTKTTELTNTITTKESEFQAEIDKFTDKGVFNPDILYYKNNYVAYNDGTGIKTYLAIANPPIGTLPTNTTYFRMLTITGQKGEDGIGIGLQFQGTWVADKTYAKDNGVQFGGILFASLIDNNVGNQPDINGDTAAWGIALDVAITTTKLRGQRTIASESNTVNFFTGEIIAFNPSVDDLEVIVNTTSSEEGIDYTINPDNQSITKVNGTWLAGTIFYFRVIRNQINNLVFSDGQSIAPNTIDKTRLTTDVQTTLNQVETNTNEITILSEKVGSETLDISGVENLSQAVNVLNEKINNINLSNNVSNFIATSISEGIQIKIDWINNTDATFIKNELFVSTTDLTNTTIDYCRTNITKIYEGNAETYTYDSIKNILYYLKIFTTYSVGGTEYISSGVFTQILAEDLTPPDPITNFIAKEGNTEVDLTWVNPNNIDFSKVKILRKTDSYPISDIDGTLIYEGSGTSFKDTGLTNNVIYYYRAFTVDTVGNINDNISQQVTCMPIPYYIYGVKIDTTNSNPETALTYTDDAIGFIPASGNNGSFSYGSWQDKFPFNQIKPCLLKSDLTVNYYLNPNNYAQKIDGVTASDITSGTDGDVMIEFPIVYWKFETIGTDLYVRYSDTQIDASYKPLAHMRGTTVKDKCYISAYLGYNLSSKLRSLSGQTPYAGGTAPAGTIGTCRTLAQANGTGFDQMAYFQILMLQVLFIIMFKSRDSQTALGRGYVDGNSTTIATGGTDAKGLFYGETTGKLQNKFCGIEDFYGNLRYWIDGFFSDASRNMLIGNQNFNDTGSGYTSYGQGATADIGGYISAVQGGTETGFVAKATAGSATTFFADYGFLYASRLPSFGGGWANADAAGAFSLYASSGASASYAYLGARLLAL